ncbi:MAG: protein kinase [Thermoanaerobaculia bacterium]
MPPRRRAVLLCGAALLCAQPLAALDPSRLLSQYRVETWGVEEGLPSLSVAAVAQTPDGYLWVGTTEGLARFDGSRFVVFDRSNTPAFQLNEVRSLLVDRSGTLWVGFSGAGLARREGESFVAVAGPEPEIYWMGEDSRGLWLGGGHGLWRLSQGSMARLPLPIEKPVIASGLFDRSGALWVTLENGRILAEQPGGSFDLVVGPKASGAERTSRMGLDSAGRVSTFTAQVAWLWQDGHWVEQRLRLPTGIAAGGLVLSDSRGATWIGLYPTGGTARLRRNGAEADVFPPGHAVAVGRFGPMLEDREGNLWLGSWTQGLMRLSDGPMTSWSTAEGLSSDAARTLLEGKDGAIWVGTTDGLNRIAGDRVRQFRRPQPAGAQRAHNWYYALAPDSEGGLWVGSQTDLARFRDGQFTGLDDWAELTGFGVFSLLRARDGALWVGTTLDNSDGATVHKQVGDRRSAYKVGGDIAFALLDDRRGSIWVAGRGGLYEIAQDGAVTHHPTPVEPLHQLFMSASEDSRGDLWFGTLEGGILRYRNGEFRLLRRQDGIFDDTAWAIVDDGLGYLWVSCARGLYRMALADLDAFFAGRVPKVRYRLFGVEDGLASATFEGGNGSAGIRARDGRLWFASMKGAAMVEPGAVEPLPVPAAEIEELHIDGERQPLGQAIDLGPGNYRLEIDYTAFHFRAPNRLRFRYRLEGVDRDWIEAGARRHAEYPAVPAGVHRFSVQSSLDGESWGQAATVAVAVAAPFWRRPWFFLAAALALVALGLALQRARVGQLRRRARELEGMVDFSRSVAGVLEPEEIGRQLERALVARWGESPRLVLAAREGRPVQRVESRLSGVLVLDPEQTAGLYADWRRPLRLAEAMMDAGNAAGPLGDLYRAGLLVAVPLVSGETVFGLLAVGGERARHAQESDLVHLSALAAQAAMALEGAWQAQEATRWRHVSEARGEWLQLDLTSRLVFAAIARQGYSGTVTDSDVRAALAAIFTDSEAATARIDAAIVRLVAEHILSRGIAGGVAGESSSELRVERDRWLLLPEIRLPLAEIVRQSAQKIGAYQLVERIGAGGMGEVYRAVNVHDGTPAAVKILFPEQTADPTARKRLEGEGKIVAAISHPNIVRLLERGEHAGRLYLAMELLPGDTLTQRLTRGKLSERRALRMGAQIAAALAELHAHGVIHRDVTAGNIMCLPDGRFVLLDFGLARGAARTTLTEAATMVGTLPYMAPEILRSESVDEASDLWSLGVVLFEALVGHLPWGEGQPTLQMALAIARLDASPEVLASVPLRSGVAELLAEMLRPDTRQRLRVAAEVAERLAALALDANAASGEVALHIG